MSDPQQTPAPHARRAKNWRRYLQFWGARAEADVDDELQLHAELRMRDYMAAGMPEEDARAAAARRIGDLTEARRQCLTISTRRHRRMTRTHTLDAFRQDLRFALRMLARQKAWTAVAVLTLALGIGASAAVFSVMNSVVLHPLPFHDSDRVVTIWLRNATQGMMTTPDHEVIAAWQANNHTFESIQEYEEGTVTLSAAGEAATLNAIWMQPDLPRFVGMPIVYGRSFTAAEAADSNAHVAIISEALWHQRFGSRDVLGSRILLDKTPYVIVGVAPASLRLHTVMVSGPTQVWLPVAPGPRPHWAMGRLRPGVTRDAAQRDLRDITAHVTRSMRSASEGFAPMLVDPAVLTDLKTSATLLSAGVVLLLIIACVNVAHLLLARGASREREISIRRAIGATRSRLARQFVTESCLLAVAGCAAGLALAYGGLRAIIALRPPSLNELAYTRMNGGVLWAAIGVSLTVGVLFALLGTRTGSRDASAESLKATTSAGTGTRRHHRLRATLVITEMALSAMLLVGAALLIRSIAKLERVDPGFDTHNLYTMAFEPPQSSYTPARTEALANELRTRAAGIPGVREVTVASSAPPLPAPPPPLPFTVGSNRT
jgi:predicted permease